MRQFLLLAAAAGAACLITARQPVAEEQCLSPTERAAFDVQALRSELMVLATGCREDDGYNAFIRRYQSALLQNEKHISEIFKRRYGHRGQTEHDRFVTELANAESSSGNHLGTDFCPRNGMMFTEVMALRGPHDLPAYAAGKDLLPPSLDLCAGAPKPTQAKASTSKSHRTATKRK
jgi:hypothetical protein